MMSNRLFRLLPLLLCILLSLSALSCGKDSPDVTTDAAQTTAAAVTTDPSESRTVLGEGEKTFSFDVVFADGSKKLYTVRTDAKTVGEALLSVELIAGEDSQYGLYVKTVCGVTLDYNKDGKYWSFYINGEYASTGVDSTDVTEGATYCFKAE